MTTLLAVMMSLVLTACTSSSAISVQASPLPPAAMLPPAAEEETIQYQVELVTWEDASQTEDGVPLVRYRYLLPEMTPLRGDGTAITQAATAAETRAREVAAAFNERFEAWAAAEDFQDLTQEAQEDLEWHRSEDIPWTVGYVLEMDCTVYQTDRMVSVSGLCYSYIQGAAHPNTWLLSWNFDLETGAFFEPHALEENQELQGAVTEEIIRRAGEPDGDGLIPAEYYWEDYREIAANWSTTAVSFDETGMTVAFSPYELAPYGFGTQSFHVTYEWMAPYLCDYGRELLGVEASE